MESHASLITTGQFWLPIVSISLSSLLCFFFNFLIRSLVPTQVKSPWKFRNISLSLFHASTSGLWALYCLLDFPQMASDVINAYSSSAYILVCFSIGYVIYDSIDMLVYSRGKESYELLGHHLVIIVCFGVAIIMHKYVGYAVVALTAEVNSIFLHTRQLMLLVKVDKLNSMYRLNSLINIGTFITFRIMVFGWMTRWLFLNKDLVPLIFFSIGSVGLAIITVMNIILFYRLLRSDFFHSIASDAKCD